MTATHKGRVEKDAGEYRCSVEVGDDLAGSLIALDALAEAITKGCPYCHVGLGQAHADGCPLKGDG